MKGRFITTIFALMAWSTVTHADPANRNEAAELFRAAMAAYDRGDFGAAALAFEEANRRTPAASTLYNAARAWDEAHDAGRAADDYALVLRARDLDAGTQSAVEKRLAELETGLGTLTISASPSTTLSIDRMHGVHAPITIHLAPGAYDVELVDGPRVSRRTWAARAGLHDKMDLEPASRIVFPSSRDTPTAVPVRGSSTFVVLGAASVALGVIGLGSAIGLGIATNSTVDEYNATGHVDADLRSRALALRTATNVTWIAGTALLAIAAPFVVLAIAHRGRTAKLGLSPRGMWVTGTF